MRGPRLLFVVLVSLSLVATLVPLERSTAFFTPPTEPEPAQSAINLIFSRGGTPARYPANSVVRIDAGNINFVQGCRPGPGGAGFPDFIQPSADLYIVPSGRSFEQGDALSDALGAPNTVFGGFGGSFVWQPLALTGSAGSARGLPSGTYDVLVDECQNRIFDEDQDGIVRNAFTVDIDQQVPGLDLEVPEFLALKARAGERLKGTTSLESVLNQILILEIYGSVKKVVPSGLTVVAAAKTFGKLAINYLAPQLSPFDQTRKFGRLAVQNWVAKRRQALVNLQNDPPDPNFQQWAGLVRDAPTASAPFPELDPAFAVLSVYESLAATEAAFLQALERYQGAQDAGNAAWAARHARTMDELATLHDELTQLLAPFAAAVETRYSGVGPLRSTQTEFTSLVNFSLRQWTGGTYQNAPSWWHSGLTPEQTDAGIAAYYDGLVNSLPSNVQFLGNAIDELGSNAAGDAAFSAELRAWVDATVPGLLTELDATIDPLLADPTVTINPVAGAAAGGVVTLGVDLPVDYVADTIRWDLDGDGAFDDATGASPDWTVPGDLRAGVPIVIAVEVVGGLTTDVAYEVVIPVAGNQPPTITQVAPDPAVGVPGATTIFEVAASDPDGGSVSIEWFVDNAPTGVTGTTFDYVVPAGFFGGINVVALATDEDGAIAGAPFLLRVLSDVDEDNDGYDRFPGPDCADIPNRRSIDPDYDPNLQGGLGGGSINPVRGEVVGNNVDDDCDPSTPDTGTPINAPRPSPFAFQGIEGDVFELTLNNWNHPNRRADQPFTLTVEWGDGQSSSQTVQGTTSGETNFLLSHQYTDELIGGDLRWCISNGADPDGCGEALGVIEIINDAPFVGASDMRTWLADDAIDNPDQCAGNNPTCRRTGGWVVGADGRSALSTSNPGEYFLLHSPLDLAEGGYGRAMAEFSALPNGDNDNLGLALGYAAGDIVGATGDEDFVDFEWTGRSRTRQTGESATNPGSCRGATDAAPPDDQVDTATISRTRGPAITHERNFNVTVNAVGATNPPANPLCTDAFGVDELAVLDLTAADIDIGTLGFWYQRSLDIAQRNTARVLLPYTFTVDYRPDRLRMWAQDGTLVADVAPRDPVNDPFPPGALGVFYWSQPVIRAKGTAPEPSFTFTQGTAGSITMPFTDGGDDEWLAVVDWGDGSSQSAGTITPNPTGHGWHDVTASHTYLRTGTFRGEVCVVDDLEASNCFTFRAVVDNLPPVVEAGPDIAAEPDLVSGATLSLEQATFTDPGTDDEHTATIDWGDGTTAAGVVTSTRSTGGVVEGSHTYAADGLYQVEVCVTDQAGATGCDTLDVDIRVTNQPPIAAVEAPTSDDVGDNVLLGGGFTDPNPDDTHTMTIDPGDGTGPQSVPVQQGPGVGMSGLEHVYRAAGTFTVTACVTDDDDAQDCADTEVVVASAVIPNEPPVADGGGPYSVDEGSSVTLDASGSSDPDGDPLTISWDLDGDGSFETSGATASFVGDDGPSSVTVRVQVCDAEPRCATAQSTVEVRSVAPTIDRFEVVVIGTSADATITYSDPSPSDTHDVTVDWGDGSPIGTATPADSMQALFAVAAVSGGTVGASHVYVPGSWTVTATVTDDDGAAVSATQTVVVTAPVGGGSDPAPVVPVPTPPPTDDRPMDPSGQLPSTGGQGPQALLLIAAATVLLGLALLLVRHRRRRLRVIT